ncbi:Paired amphipathic helix protein pst3 [Schizosaccharomyces pombe]
MDVMNVPVDSERDNPGDKVETQSDKNHLPKASPSQSQSPVNTSLHNGDGKDNGVATESVENKQILSERSVTRDDYEKGKTIVSSLALSSISGKDGSISSQNAEGLSSSSNRPLDVNDALSYLELVKYYFSERREIYNRFLEIMRDFKSQALDTLGVINRVSELFNGYPQLIEGFNTFLPSGYKIEVQLDSSNTSVVRVGTPMHPLPQQGVQSTLPVAPSNEDQRTMESTSPTDSQPQPSAPNLVSSTENEKPRVDFNYAIAYMNKVKARYPPNSDTYMEFLGVLRTYQKAQKSIFEVRARVAEIFKDSPDLLEEFKLFLPDNVDSTEPSTPNVQKSPNRLPPVGNFSLPPSAPVREKRNRPAHSAQISRSISKTSRMYRQTAEEPLNSYSLHVYPQKITAPTSPYAATQEELLAFTTIRQHLPDTLAFHKFLELLHLYREKLLDKTELLNSFSKLVRNDNLTLWFSEFIRWSDNPILVKNEPVDERVYLPETFECISLTYRKLPDSWKQDKCSGRDDLDNSVLNDDYISVAPKPSHVKNIMHHENQYLQALQLVEDERYDYDRVLNTTESAIKILANFCEPTIHEHLETALQELERSKRIIKNALIIVYGKEHANLALDTLFKKLPTAAPVLLKRIKTKDQEWRRSKREWSKIWRQIEKKNAQAAFDDRYCRIEGRDRRGLSYSRILRDIDDIYQRQKHRIDGAKLGFQFTQVLCDSLIFLNILRLSDAQLTNSSFYSYADKGRISAVLKALLSQFFGIPLPREALETNLASENIESVKKHRDGLSKIFIRPESADNSNNTNVSFQTDETQTEDETMSDIHPDDVENHSKSKFLGEESKNIIGYNFFGNATMYVLFRLICVCYSRLEHIKLFVESSTIYASSTGGYENILNICEKYLKGSCSRLEFRKYLQKFNNETCYMICSIERLLKVIFYRIHEILLDPKLGQLLLLFESDGANSVTTPREQMVYRNHVESILAPESKIFNMRWYPLEKRLCIQQLLPADLTMHDFENPAKAFMYYVDSYAISHITEGVDLMQVKMPFLRRSLQRISQQGYLAGRGSGRLHSLFNEHFCKSNLQLFFSTDTYVIFFEPNTENVYINSYNLWVDQSSQSKKQNRTTNWRRWLESDEGWRKSKADTDIKFFSETTLDQCIEAM